MSATETPVSALELVEQAAQALELEDPRRHLLEALGTRWAATQEAHEARWRAATALVRWDRSNADDLTAETLYLLAQITDQFEDVNPEGCSFERRDDLATTARELRSAYERLGEIVRAVTAVHLLGDSAR